MSGVRKNFFYNLIFTISNIIFPIVTFPYASRVLGPEGIGKVQFITTFAQYFVLVAVLGIPIYGIREVAKCRHNMPALKKLFTELVFLNFLMSMFLIVVYAIIIYLVPSMKADWNFYAVALLILIFSSCNIDWFFSGLEKFRFIAIRSVIIKAVSIILLFILVKTREDDIYYLWITVGSIVLANFWNLITAFKYINVNWLYKKEFFKHLKPLLYIFSTSAAISVYAVSDVLILGFFKGYIEVGYYTAATRINKVTIPILTALGTVLIPKISNAFQNNQIHEVKSLAKYSLDFVILLGIPMTVGLITLAPELIILFSGEEFIPATLTMQIFAPVVLIIGLSNVWAIQILTPAGRDKQVTFSVFLGLIVSVLLNFALIPHFSYTGAAISNLLSELVVMIAFTFFTYRLIKLNFNLKLTLQTIFISLLFVPIIYVIREMFDGQEFIVCLLGVLCCSLLYILLQIFVIKNNMILTQIESLRGKTKL